MGAAVEVRGQLVGSLLPSYSFWGRNSGQAWPEALLPIDPSPSPPYQDS